MFYPTDDVFGPRVPGPGVGNRLRPEQEEQQQTHGSSDGRTRGIEEGRSRETEQMFFVVPENTNGTMEGFDPQQNNTAAARLLAYHEDRNRDSGWLTYEKRKQASGECVAWAAGAGAGAVGSSGEISWMEPGGECSPAVIGRGPGVKAFGLLRHLGAPVRSSVLIWLTDADLPTPLRG
ncbi:hypothetical protein AXG93_3005s1270 [Marchantia polymorpha subsp. ruderalis]|uniref:Uncharacterized protein n=1 Tax=Marchantia polymorpha subsp. ruderalis TaxID=1480154 RepID=A0A176WMX1_MARPO|nr:hypothetical protein AXG93_3005s1270 [Marchantia polymorpha subsp. ruderalis]